MVHRCCGNGSGANNKVVYKNEAIAHRFIDLYIFVHRLSLRIEGKWNLFDFCFVSLVSFAFITLPSGTLGDIQQKETTYKINRLKCSSLYFSFGWIAFAISWQYWALIWNSLQYTNSLNYSALLDAIISNILGAKCLYDKNWIHILHLI